MYKKRIRRIRRISVAESGLITRIIMIIIKLLRLALFIASFIIRRKYIEDGTRIVLSLLIRITQRRETADLRTIYK
jgi:hypothetical protein